MKKTIRINEDELRSLVTESAYRFLCEKQSVTESLTRSDVNSEIEDYVKTKDFEKRVHNIVVDALNELVQNMWSKKSFWTNMLKKK